ncbi:tyrosine-protein phosphatase [Parabacteroides sp.]
MFSLLFPKKNAVRTDLFRGTADVHSHLLPGVDDGVQSVDDMRAALKSMREAGVERVFLTPHVMADLPDNRRGYLLGRFACVKMFAPEGIELRLVAEYMLDAGFRLQMADGLLTYADRQVLVETSYLSPPPDYLNLLYELRLEGYTPVLAHPERYMYMTKVDYFRLKDKGYKFQLNLFSLAGVYGSRPAKYAAYLMKEGFYDYAGSDLHHPDDYERNLTRLKLSGKMIDRLKRVLENNKRL